MNNPKNVNEIDIKYITEILQSYLRDDNLVVNGLMRSNIKGGLFGELGTQIFRFDINYDRQLEGAPIAIILKASPSDKTIYLHWLEQIRESHSIIPEKYIPDLRLNFREIMTYRDILRRVSINYPSIYHSIINENDDQLWLFMEDIKHYHLIDAWPNEQWDEYWLLKAIEDLAVFHKSCYEYAKHWEDIDWLFQDPPNWIEHTKLATEVNLKMHPEYLFPAREKIIKKMLSRLERFISELNMKSKVIVHGDCTPRNACFDVRGTKPKLTLFDWSFTSIAHPGEDISSFILAMNSPQRSWGLIIRLLKKYYSCWPKVSNSFEQFFEEVVLSSLLVLCSKIMACAWNNPCDVKWLFTELDHHLDFMEQTENIWTRI